jgi:hypothetical protein
MMHRLQLHGFWAREAPKDVLYRGRRTAFKSRRKPYKPAMPIPNRAIEAGSGTIGVKETEELPETFPMFVTHSVLVAVTFVAFPGTVNEKWANAWWNIVMYASDTSEGIEILISLAADVMVAPVPVLGVTSVKSLRGGMPVKVTSSSVMLVTPPGMGESSEFTVTNIDPA